MSRTLISIGIAVILATGLAACANTDAAGTLENNASLDAHIESADGDLTAADGGQTTTIEDTDKRKEGWGSTRGTIKMNGLSAASLGLRISEDTNLH